MDSHQNIIWIPEAQELCGTNIVPEVLFEFSVPERVFCLLDYTDEKNPPKIPFKLEKKKGVILEDSSNWNISGGYFVYMNRKSKGGFWALLDYAPSIQSDLP